MSKYSTKNSEILLPYNLLAEKLVLGILLTLPENLSKVRDKLPIDAFYLKRHQIIYKGILVLSTQEKSIDYINLVTWLQDYGFIKNIGGSHILLELLHQVKNLQNLEEYVGLIYEKYLRRLLIQLGEEIIEAGYLTNLPLEIIFQKIEQRYFRINDNNSSKNIISVEDGLKNILLEIEEGLKISKISGLKTEFCDLDLITQGFQNSELVIIAGRPSMGKTAFAFNIAKNIAFNQNISIVFFSLEMTREQLLYRLLASEVGITNIRLKAARIKKTEWIEIKKTISRLSKLNLFIDDTSNLSVAEIKLKIKTINLEFSTQISLIIIDYLQLLKSLDNKNTPRVQELSQITRDLKNLARYLNIPIIVLSQLSRNVESRINKRPILSDLRESGCISFTRFIPKSTDSYFSSLFSLSKKNFRKYKSLKVKFTGRKPTYALQTLLGYSLFITSHHKILTSKGWKKIEHLLKTDFICTKLILNMLIDFNKKNTFFCTWERILKLKFNTILPVFDLQVPHSSNFLLKNIFIHNSIEQDADIVIMLYRDEYYNNNTLNKNIVEIIVAKHRNGPIGSAKLKFDPKYLRFFNL